MLNQKLIGLTLLLVVAVVKLATNAARTRCARRVSRAYAVLIPPRPYPFAQVPHPSSPSQTTQASLVCARAPPTAAMATEIHLAVKSHFRPSSSTTNG